MNRRILILLCIIFNFTFFIGLQAQETWVHTYNPFTDSDGYASEDILICSDGGYALNGWYQIESGPQNYYYIGYVMKVDSDGNFIWAEADTISFMGENQSSAFVETDDGGFISAAIPFWGGNGALIKRDYNGNREWIISTDYWVHSMDKTNDGNIILAGSSQNGAYLMKMTQNGVEIWSHNYQLTSESGGIPKSVYPASDGGYLITGHVYSDDNNFDIFIIKTNEYGDTLWTKTYDGYGSGDVGNCIIETIDDKILIVGRTSNPITIGLIWLLDFSGNTIWLEEVDPQIGWEHFSVINLPDSTFITLSVHNYTGKLYNFDIEYNILWEWENSGGGAGDRSFRYDDNCLIYAYGPDITLHKDTLPQVSINYDNVELSDNYLSNYPNPFNPSTTISFSIKNNSKVNLTVFNIKGQKIKTLIHNDLSKGNHSIIWNGDDQSGNSVSSGIYLYKLNVNGKTEAVKRCLLLK